jgi:ubiquitin carboxyl-terminal hydrolase 25/28
MLLPELNGQLLCDLSLERGYISDELDMLRASAVILKQELEDIWREEHEAVYEFTSVSIHRGSTPQRGQISTRGIYLRTLIRGSSIMTRR